MTEWPVMSAAEIRAAEQAIFDAGMPVIDLMEKAGEVASDIIAAHFERQPALVLAGPGNNGGDGYVIARCLTERGWPVTVAMFAEPKSPTARLARQRWQGPVAAMDAVATAPLLIDALFGIGLVRPLDPQLQRRLAALAEAADNRVAIDLPSGVTTDDGRMLGDVPRFDLTIALGTLKPAHVREPGKDRCGKTVVGDIGLIPKPQ